MPVDRPQANGAQPSSDASGLTLASAISGMTVYSAKVDVPMKCFRGSPLRLNLVVPSGRKPSPCWSRIATQRFVRSERQWMHSPHSGANSVTTWSSGGDERDAVAHALDDTGALVAEHARHVARWVGARSGVEIGVADAAGDQPYEDLARLGLGQLDVLDDEWPAELLEHCSPYLHGSILEEAG